MGRSQKRMLAAALGLLISGCTAAKVEPPVATLAVEAPKLSPGAVFGEDYYAVQSSYWNLPHSFTYPMPAPSAYGSLDTSFGTNIAPISALLTSTGTTKYRVHIINGPCIRDGNCGQYEIGRGFNKVTFNNAVLTHEQRVLAPYRQRVGAYRDLASHFPGVTFYLSPVLEHDLSEKAWRILADTARQVWPGVTLDNSPDGGVPIEHYLGALFERHGDHPQPDADINSLDGISATQIDIDAWIHRIHAAPHILIAFLWIDLFNCRSDVFQDPPSRKTCPSLKTFELVRHLIDTIPSAPTLTATVCHIRRPFADPDIWKPLSETHPTPDPRSELPVLITKGFGKGNVNVIASNGHNLGTMGFYGTYLDQGYRWYSGYPGGSRNSGYEFQKAAVAATGSPWVWLQQGTTCKGPLVPGRRQGSFK